MGLLAGLSLIAFRRMFPPVPDGPLPTQIDWIMHQAHERGELNGSVLIVRDSDVLYERSFGMADGAMNVPNGPGTRFLIGSLSKPITAILILQQVEAGNLTLEAALASVLPELTATPAGEITIHQLLTHTSGIEEVISRDPSRRITAANLRTAQVQLGGAFEYSNTGFVTLALVLEAVTALPYEAIVHQYVFEPAGMSGSGVVRTGRPIEGLALGYRLEGGSLVPVSIDYAIEATDGAGSLYSTAPDLARLDRALADGTLLSPQSLSIMNAQHVRGRFGYGWFLTEQDGQYFPWHAGEIPGYSSAFARQTHRREAVVILANLQDTDPRGLQREVLRVLKRQPAATASPP
jgi:CubicO group peptidase (beta-lactamase class C family)